MIRVIIFSLALSLVVNMVNAKPLYQADVSVDVTANTVAEAKKQAMNKAIRDGLNNVILSVSTQATVDEVNKLNDNQIQHFISEMMVLMEKTSDVRYIADLRISINEEVLNAYIQENNLPMIISEEKNILVIPLLEKENGELDLWSDENSWRKSVLERKNIRKGNLNIFCIQKNLGNITAIETNRVFDMSDDVYNEMLSFNRVDDIYVLKYSLKDGKVYVKSFSDKNVSEEIIDNDDYQIMLDKVLKHFKVAKGNEDIVQLDTVMDDVLEVVYSYSKLKDWMDLKKLLDSNPQIKDVEVLSMAKGKVHFRFNYNGVLEKLQTALSLKGYKLKEEGEFYVIN